MTEQSVTTTVVHNDDQHRYEVWYGDSLAGFSEYRERDDDIVFVHTEIDPAFGGKGLGSVLAHDSVEDVIIGGHGIVPRCAFIKGWLDKHPEYDAYVVGKGLQR